MGNEKELGNVMVEDVNTDSDISSQYALDFLTLRKAIVDNCRDCIRDCGRDCLDKNVKPLENIRCPLQKVRIDFEIVIEEKAQEDPEVFSSEYHGFELK
jgi:hypothetical protein